MIERIMVAVDGSDASVRAVDVACELARAVEAELVVFHAVRDMALPPELREMIDAGEIHQSRKEILEQSGEIILDRALARARDAGVARISTTMKNGDPGSVIVSHASDIDADLVVMGSRGLGEVRSMLLGSVSRKVCNLASVSCLTVK